jgi:hypothetical protein
MNHTAAWTSLLTALTLATACEDGTPAVGPARVPIRTGTGSMAMTTCSATFRMIAVDPDSLMSAYGLPSVVDTVDVCESWTGNDYTYQATLIGSSDNIPDFPDTVQTVTYAGGYTTGYDAANNLSSEPDAAGGTSFDLVVADGPTRQASFDYPYYAISSPDPTPSSCIQAPCPVMSVVAPMQAARDGQASSPFSRHGLSRRGVRALVDSAVELSPSPNGWRRFQSVRGDHTQIRSIDPKTELLVAEEEWSPQDTARITHTWRKAANGYVRQHTDIETTDLVRGRWLRAHSEISFKKIHVHDATFVFDDDDSQ